MICAGRLCCLLPRRNDGSCVSTPRGGRSRFGQPATHCSSTWSCSPAGLKRCYASSPMTPCLTSDGAVTRDWLRSGSSSNGSGRSTRVHCCLKYVTCRRRKPRPSSSNATTTSPPLGIEAIRLDVRVEVTDDNRIKKFTARPTPESIEALTAARRAGRSSEGLQLAEGAGTIAADDSAT